MTNKDLGAGGLDRRRFLQLGAVGAVGIAGGSLLAGCGGSDNDNASQGTPASSEPQRGGTARVTVIPNSTDQLDPAKFVGTSFDSIAGASLYSTLTRVSSTYELSGDIASDWDSPDATTWTFRLADGVTFHNGQPLTSADIAFTLKRILDPKLASGGAALIADLKPNGIATPDPTTIRLKLERANAFLPVSLAWINFGIVPDGTTDFAKGVGSGPFTLDRFETGASAQYSRFDDYFKSGRPYLDAVDVLGSADDAAQIQALLSDETDLLHLVPFNQVERVRSSPGAELIELPGGQWATFAARTNGAPFDDPKIVEAIKLAVDRQKFSDVAYAGLASPAADVPIPEDDLYYPAGLEPRAHDPERARALLTEAGHPDGIELELFTRDAGNFLENATALKSLVEGSGISLKLNNVPSDSYFDRVWLKEPFCCDVWGRSHASYILPVAYGTKGSSNETAFANPQFDGLVADAAKTTDLEEQKRYFGDAITLIHESSGSITPVHVPMLMARSKRLQGLIPDWGARTYLEDAYFA